MTEGTPKAGDQMPAFVAPPLTITDSVRYQGASGDMNPSHHDADLAREAGHPDAFTVGMLPAGVLAGRISAWLPPGAPRRFLVRFLSQTWPGDSLSYGGRIAAVRACRDSVEVDVEMTVRNQAGTLCIGGESTWVLSDDG